jgi:hypothetical protein
LKRISHLTPVFGGRFAVTDAAAQDIAYFRSSIAPEDGDGPVGWAVAAALVEHLTAAGAESGPLGAHWDGVKWPCRVQGRAFELEVTPYFEVQPVEWSVEIRRTGWLRMVPAVSRRAEEALRVALHRCLTSDERFTLLQWASLQELARAQRARSRQ